MFESSTRYEPVGTGSPPTDTSIISQIGPSSLTSQTPVHVQRSPQVLHPRLTHWPSTRAAWSQASRGTDHVEPVSRQTRTVRSQQPNWRPLSAHRTKVAASF